MTTHSDRPNTALVVIDVQNGVVDGAHDRDGVVGRIASLVDRARDEGTPVVWVQHQDEQLPEGSEAWRYVPELAPGRDEPLVAKRYGDSFEDTDLESVLEDRGVGRLVVAGASTDACIRSTLHGAFARGYDVTLVSDGHTTQDLREHGVPFSPEESIAYTNTYWSFTGAPERTASVEPAAEVRLNPGA